MNNIIYVDNIPYSVPPHWFWKEYCETGWEPNTFKIFQKYIDNNTHFVDIGAWVGITSLYALSCGCKNINAVEANPKSYEILQKVIMINNLNEYIKCKNICIYNKNNESIKFGRDTSSASQIADNGEYVVVTQTLNNFLEEINIQQSNVFIKIDIEGSEIYIMNDIYNIINMGAKVFLSLHPPFYKDKKQSCYEIISCLKNMSLQLSDGNITNTNEIENMLLSEEKYPNFGTKHGNFFEILCYK